MANKVELTNPAQRLLDILNTAAGVLDLQESRSQTYRVAWGIVFNLDISSEEGYIELVSRLVALRDLFDEVIAITNELPGTVEKLHIQPILELREIMRGLASMERAWSEFTPQIDYSRRVRLEYVVHLISVSGLYDERLISEKELEAIAQEAQQTYDAILKSKLSHGVKFILLDIVHDLIRAIHEYRIRGAEAVKAAVSRAAGALIINKDVVDANKDTDALQRVADLMDKADKIYKIAKSSVSLLGVASKLIPMLGPGPD